LYTFVVTSCPIAAYAQTADLAWQLCVDCMPLYADIAAPPEQGGGRKSTAAA
jgi:hypothetical protein